MAPKVPPARLSWIMLARAAEALLLGLSVLLAEKPRPAQGIGGPARPRPG